MPAHFIRGSFFSWENIASVSQRLDGGKDATRKEDASVVVNYARINSAKDYLFPDLGKDHQQSEKNQ